MEIWLVRHAATAWNEEGRHQGRSDVPLSAVGERQAELLRGVLPGGFDAVRASSLRRARRTARIASGREPEVLEDLREIDRGEWEGLLPAEIEVRWPDLHRRWYEDPRGLSMPGGEAFDALWERAGSALGTLATSGRRVLAVAHKAINRVVIARALGRPTKGVWGIPQPQACLTVLRGGAGGDGGRTGSPMFRTFPRTCVPVGSGMVVLALTFVLAAPADEEFLLERIRELAQRYDEQARRQTGEARRLRGGIVREVAHLPFEGGAREQAGALLARIVATEPSYRLRADAARAIGHVGTPRALESMVASLFGPDGRSHRYALLHAVLPEALAGLRRAEDLEWLSKQVLEPAASGEVSRMLRLAGPLRTRLVTLALEGVGRARARVLGPVAARLAGAEGREVRVAALRALAALEWADPALARALRASHPAVRAAAAAHPGLKPDDAAAALADPEARVRRAAIRGLAAGDAVAAIPLLVARLADEEESIVRLDLRDALNRLTGKEFADADLWRSWWEANRDRFSGSAVRDDSERTYFFDLSMRTDRVAFLIDVSASMSRRDERGVSRLEDAARELGTTLAGLPPTARFVILAFAADIRRFPDDGEGALAARGPGDRTSAAAAVEWLLERKPAGATNTYGALMEALHDDRFAPDAIVLLSDGNPYRCAWQGKTWSEHEQILAAVREVNADRGVRIHTVALLSGARADDDEEDAQGAADFLRRLAIENGGDFREIR